jgi:hypothetical protein
MSKPCVVYLARAGNDLSAFERFLRSYLNFPSGIPHEFLVVLKGFKNEQEVLKYQTLVQSLGPKFFRISDFGFDLRAYSLVARSFDNPYFCFFNSFSEILGDNWLAKMLNALQRPNIGAVGATGSHESMFTNVLVQRTAWVTPTLSQRLWTPFRLALCRACFDPFPNYHLRTNAFIIRRELMLKIWPRMRLTKRGAYLFENGKDSLTKRILRLRQKVQVIGKNGKVYEPPEWPHSCTFRSGDQENLLVGDNQTRDYAKADAQRRKYLRQVAWGLNDEGPCCLRNLS